MTKEIARKLLDGMGEEAPAMARRFTRGLEVLTRERMKKGPGGQWKELEVPVRELIARMHRAALAQGQTPDPFWVKKLVLTWLRQLAEADFGQFIPGRRGYQTRFIVAPQRAADAALLEVLRERVAALDAAAAKKPGAGASKLAAKMLERLDAIEAALGELRGEIRRLAQLPAPDASAR